MSEATAQLSDAPVLLTMKQVGGASSSSEIPSEVFPTYRLLHDWIRSYLMSSHRDLGRSGDVCPFTAQASRLDTIRIGVCEARSSDLVPIVRTMHRCFEEFERIACPRSMRHFRTIIVGFPKLSDEEGLDCLRAAQAQLKFYSLVRAKMVGLFHGEAEAPGLWNPSFRPLRSPIPLLAIRHLVENDAPFVARHPLLVPTYLVKFPVTGSKRLFAHFAKRQ
jgi:hypothetical protein